MAYEEGAHSLMEVEARRNRVRMACMGSARVLSELSRPCRCTGLQKNCHLWHNYRPLVDKLEDIMEGLVAGFVDAECIVVAATASIIKFLEAHKRPICKDQFLRLAAVSICVNAKFWDEGAAKELQNSKFSCRTRIPLDELNMMEIAFLKGLDWNLYLKEEEYERWASILSSKAELSFSEEERAMDSARRNNSPLCSTDLAESIAEILGDCNMVKEELLSVPKKPTAYFIQSNGSSNLYTYAL